MLKLTLLTALLCLATAAMLSNDYYSESKKLREGYVPLEQYQNKKNDYRNNAKIQALILQKNRIIYKVEGKLFVVISCLFHYQ
jgi:hypothetical protein